MDEERGVNHYGRSWLSLWFSQWILWKWRILVHVCHRWRQIVFASPRRLDLQIPCTLSTPLMRNLAIWPVFPIVVVYDIRSNEAPIGEDNIIAALMLPDRVCEVEFLLFGPRLREIAAVMQEPFPVLRRLDISLSYIHPPALLPTGFLGGSAPCLQEISLCYVPYPALPTLLLSTSDLVKLVVLDIPSDGYISPEAIAASLAALPRLETFSIGFEEDTPRPDWIPPPPVTRTVLPALTSFTFQGVSEYLEDLVGRIDSPHLNHISISYMYQPFGFQVTRLSKFIDRSVGPKITRCRHAEIRFFPRGSIAFDLCHGANNSDQDRHLATAIIVYNGVNWRVTPISQVLSQFPVTLDKVVHLRLKRGYKEDQTPVPEIEWSHLLRQFYNMQMLLVHQEFSEHVALSLEDIADEMATEVLPSLKLICLEGEHIPSLDKFVAARLHSDCPVTVVNTIQEFKEKRESYSANESASSASCVFYRLVFFNSTLLILCRI